MSYTACYSPVFTGTMDDPSPGTKITDYENYEHLLELEDLVYHPHEEWRTDDPDSYPRTEHAYFYGYTQNRDDNPYLNNMNTTVTLHKCTPGYFDLFMKAWQPIAMTCKPFSVIMSPRSGGFPRTNEIAFDGSSSHVVRLDMEPGKIEHWEVPTVGDEDPVHHDTYTWEVDIYEEERFLGGINY